MELTKVMQALYNSEINCGLSSDWDAGFTIWIGDEMNGRDMEGYFDNKDLDKAASWLSSAAIKVYPDSEYAKSFK